MNIVALTGTTARSPELPASTNTTLVTDSWFQGSSASADREDTTLYSQDCNHRRRHTAIHLSLFQPSIPPLVTVLSPLLFQQLSCQPRNLLLCLPFTRTLPTTTLPSPISPYSSSQDDDPFSSPPSSKTHTLPINQFVNPLLQSPNRLLQHTRFRILLLRGRKLKVRSILLLSPQPGLLPLFCLLLFSLFRQSNSSLLSCCSSCLRFFSSLVCSVRLSVSASANIIHLSFSFSHSCRSSSSSRICSIRHSSCSFLSC